MKNATIKTKIKKEHEEHNSKNHKRSHNLKSFDLRNKLISKVKSVQEQELERQKNRVKKYKSGKLLGKALERSSKERSPSVNSISSDDSILSDKVAKKKKKKTDESELSVEDEVRKGIVL